MTDKTELPGLPEPAVIFNALDHSVSFADGVRVEGDSLELFTREQLLATRAPAAVAEGWVMVHRKFLEALAVMGKPEQGYFFDPANYPHCNLAPGEEPSDDQVIDLIAMSAQDILAAAPAPAEVRHLTITTDESGRCVAVTWQDNNHRILETVWEAPAESKPAEPVAWTRTEFIYDDDGRDIGLDEPRLVWGAEHPDPSECWTPLYALPTKERDDG